MSHNRLRDALAAEQTARIITIANEDQVASIGRYAPYAEAAELRADLFPSREPSYLYEQAARLSPHLGVLLTIRSVNEGGEWQEGLHKKLEIIEQLLPVIDGVDTETLSFGSSIIPELAHENNKVVISSHHQRHDSSSDLSRLNHITGIALNQQGADYAKLAVMARHPRMSRAIVRYSLGADRRIICMGMGPYGEQTRVSAIRAGSAAVYISPVLPGDTSSPVVEGQLDYLEADRLIQDYRQRQDQEFQSS